MIAVAVAGILSRNYAWVPAAIIAIFVSTIPAILRRDLNIVLPPELNFLIVLALFLHVVGGFSNFYTTLPGWDHLTHMMSASLVGALGLVLVVTVDKYVETIYLPRGFVVVIIILFTMAVGVLWEIMEFANDSIAHTHLQYGPGVDDTMLDLCFDALAGFVVAFLGARYLRRTSPDRFVESMGIDQARQKLIGIVQRRRAT